MNRDRIQNSEFRSQEWSQKHTKGEGVRILEGTGFAKPDFSL
jgi:hypothetical protein